MSKTPIGLQLYTVRDEMAKDYRGTIRQVAAIGYAGVELAGPNVLEAAELRDLLAELNLRPCGAHIGLGEFESNLDAVIAYHRAIGNPYLGVPALRATCATPRVPPVAATMNRVGAEVKAAA
jgi:sugar phosphate isomerase/epimerase